MTLVDYNRAGVPLMELVTEPVIHSAEQAVAFARELQRILRYVGASEANMDMGQMRIEANISVSQDPNKFGTKVEVKNINSFAAVFGAINYEVARHIELIESGGAVVQETRGWDEGKQSTFSQRKKENAHDYRYFPDPDLPKLYLSKLFNTDEIKASLPEMPASRRARMIAAGLKEDVVEIIISDPLIAVYFDEVTTGKDVAYQTLAANYLVADIFGLLKKENKGLLAINFPSVASFKTLLDMIQSNELSSRGAKDLLSLMITDIHIDVMKTAEEKGMIQKNDPELLKNIVAEVIAENPIQVADYKSGKESMFMFFVGQCMKKSKGAGNPGMFQELLKEALK
jgi:aspartyl-tRNA(Asn)/glutamyl-tRNA(Gln) amidotransferase subunit B